MLKSHKQNLYRNRVHIREERVKAQKTDGDTNTKQAPTPPLLAPEKKRERERERARGRAGEETTEGCQGERPRCRGKAAEAMSSSCREKEQEKERVRSLHLKQLRLYPHQS